MKLMLIALGGFSLLVGFLGVFALMRDHPADAEKYVPKGWFLGVCADIAQILRVPVFVIRFLVLFYTPFVIGLLFYLIYAWLLRRRKRREADAAAQKPERRPATITKIDSIHYP